MDFKLTAKLPLSETKPNCWHSPSVLTILDKYKNNSTFTFSHVTKKEVLREICNLDTTKSSQDTNILTKVIKQNSDIFASFIRKT